MSQVRAAFVHRRDTGRRLHVVTENSKFQNVKRRKGMTIKDVAMELAKNWARHGVLCDVTVGIYNPPPVGYSFDADFIGEGKD